MKKIKLLQSVKEVLEAANPTFYKEIIEAGFITTIEDNNRIVNELLLNKKPLVYVERCGLIFEPEERKGLNVWTCTVHARDERVPSRRQSVSIDGFRRSPVTRAHRGRTWMSDHEPVFTGPLRQ